jgi:hypothetical protein
MKSKGLNPNFSCRKRPTRYIPIAKGFFSGQVKTQVDKWLNSLFAPIFDWLEKKRRRS